MSGTRVAVVGLGWAARSIWLRRLRAHPAYTVTAVVDPDPAARAAAGDGGGRVLASVDDLDPDTVDLAVVAVPNHLHCPVACRLLERDLAVFVEKPVCLSSAEARRLAAAERAGGGILLAGSAARHRADVRALYETVRGIGEVRHIEVSWVRANGVPSAGGWFTRRGESGGGALVDLGWHLLDVAGPLLDPLRFDRVLGTTSGDFIAGGDGGAVWRGPRADAGGAGGPGGTGGTGGTGDVEDTARGFMVTPGGVSVAVRVGWASHEPSDVTSVRVEGTVGTAVLRCTFGFSPDRTGGSSLSLTRKGLTSTVPVAQEPIGTEYDRQVDALGAQLAEPGAKGLAAAEAARIIDVIERLYDSARPAPSDLVSEHA